jgi:hypothetical protein
MHSARIGPPGHGVVIGGTADPMKYSTIYRQIAMAQQIVDTAYRYAFRDWQGETGRAGTAVRLARAAPLLAQPELTHVTAQRCEASGRAFACFLAVFTPKY